MHTIETKDPENLFGLWSLFTKCSSAMEHGRRYENMAWRIWARETFCCAPDHVLPPGWSVGRRLYRDCDVPELSCSVESDSSKSETALTNTTTSRSNSSTSRPDLSRQDSTDLRTRGKEKHISPIDLVKVVNSIQEKKDLEPLSPLPPQMSQKLHAHLQPTKPAEDTTPRPSSPLPTRSVPESSTSTVATALGSDGMSPTVASDVTASTELSSNSVVVHGFVPGQISQSVRSSTSLNSPAVTKSADQPKTEPAKIELPRKKKTVFVLGASSDEDNNSSFESSMLSKRSSLSEGLQKPSFPKKPAFSKSTAMKTIKDTSSCTEESDEEAIEDETDSEADSDNAIDDDSDGEWEDDDNNSDPSSVNDKEMFQRVESHANLTSRRSLLTVMMTSENDRKQAFQNAATLSQPVLRRSRTHTPNGPSTGNSPQEDSGLMMRTQVPRSKPIIMTTSNVHPPTLSPRTTRRNMLQTELTESLRKHLLWERQQKNATTNAVNKRQSAVSLPALRRAATTNDIKGLNTSRDGMAQMAGYPPIKPNTSSVNEFFDQGLQEYHQKGW